MRKHVLIIFQSIRCHVTTFLANFSSNSNHINQGGLATYFLIETNTSKQTLPDIQRNNSTTMNKAIAFYCVCFAANSLLNMFHEFHSFLGHRNFHDHSILFEIFFYSSTICHYVPICTDFKVSNVTRLLQLMKKVFDVSIFLLIPDIVIV